MEQVHKIKALITTVLSSILDHEFTVEVMHGGTTDLYTIYPHKDEIKFVIGAKGRTINALRHLLICINSGKPNTRRSILVCDGAD
jgi:predicted RNA-binding protein YlqC (UPF0109 family)